MLLLFLIAGTTSAQKVGMLSKVLDGSKNELVQNNFITVRDAGFLDADKSKLDSRYSTRNIIHFHINEYSTQLLPDSFTAIVKVRITYKRPDAAYDSLEQTLIINYTDTATYTSRNSFVFNNAHEVTVRVLGLTITRESAKVMNALLLENEMEVRAVYVMDCASDAVKSISHENTPNTDSTDEVTVQWTPVASADEYDLEWTFIDSSALLSGRYGPVAQPDPALVFKNNSSRVTIPGYNTGYKYRIPLLFEGPGILFYRIRAVQVLENDFRKETLWSSDFANPLTGFSFVGHQNALNWQSNIAFAEEGKRNVTVSYFDGSLRNRQTVTKDNTTNTTIVAENLYDYQGREVIKVMPAPTLNTVIRYSANFNQGLNGVPYDKSLYDNLSSPADFATASAPAMSTGSGASQYYSLNNPLVNEGVNKYIPDAGGYAFTETSYTQDGTGRVSRQSGVGPVFKLGSNHETKYFYASPSDNDLNVLFGTEAGDITHYFKNGVQDANGQMSITYVDMHGRTIATALAGKADSADLDNLESNVEFKVVDTLSRAGSNSVNGMVLESTRGLLISVDGPQYSQSFRYALQPPVLRKPCGTDTICYNGLYDLEISVTDELNHQNYYKLVRNYKPDSIIATCTKPDSIVVAFALQLPKGSYQVTKRLTVSRAALEFYRDSIYLQQQCLKTLNEFIQAQRSLVSKIDCAPTCAGCRAAVGDWITFKANYGGDSTAAFIAYNDAVAACDALCGTTSPATEKLDIMLEDVSAPSGQYATLSDSSYAYSIFYHKTDSLPKYMLPTITYLDENGRVDSVYDESAGVYVRPQALSAEAFAENFKPSWAKALVQFHPEYCRYLKYTSYEKALQWDRAFEGVDTYAEALDKGYLNPIGDGVSFPFKVVTGNIDPLSVMIPLKSKLENYTGGTGTNALSLYSVAAIMTKCGDLTASCAATYNTPAKAFSSGLCAGDQDMIWHNFRSLYLAYKDHLIDSLVMAANCSPTTNQLIVDSKTPRFMDASSALTMAGYSYMTSGDTSKVKDSVNVDVKASYESNCNSYINAWIRQLTASCTYYDTAELRAKVIPQLKAICMAGSDEHHLFGSSSTPSGDNSFQKVLAAYNQEKGITDNVNCNGLLITAPGAYDKQRANYDEVTYAKPTDCECEKLRVLNVEYKAFKRSTDTSLTVYLNRTRGTSLTEGQVRLLQQACDSAGSSCKYLSSPVTIPPLMQCNTAPACVSCQEFSTLYANYNATYPGLAPAYEDTSSLQQQKNKLFAAYMNNATGYNYQAWQYLAFRDTCALSQKTDSIAVCTTANTGSTLQTYTRNSYSSVFYDIINTVDNGMLLAGQIKNASGNYDAYLVKTTATGQVSWAKTYGNGGNDYFNRIRLTGDSGYIVLGTTGVGGVNSAFIVKLQSNGDVSWSKVLNDKKGITGQDIIQTDSGYVMALRHQTLSSVNGLVVSLKPNGDARWAHLLDLKGSGNEGYSIVQNKDTLVMVGCSFANIFGTLMYNMVVTKLYLSTGNVIPNSTIIYNKQSSRAEQGYSAQLFKTSKGFLFNFTATFWKSGSAPQTNANIVVGINNTGNILFSKQFRNPFGVLPTQWMPIAPTSDGGIMAVQNYGTTPSRVLWQKLGSDTNMEWADMINTKVRTDIHGVIERPDGTYAAIGNYGDSSMLMISKGVNKVGCLDSVFTTGVDSVGMDVNRTTTWTSDSSYLITIKNNGYLSNYPVTVSNLKDSINRAIISCAYPTCSTIHNGPLLCGNVTPVFNSVTLDTTNSCTDAENHAVMAGTEQYKAYRDSLSGNFAKEYLDTALAGGQREVFTLTYTSSEYHYTLYYYDQAGNLIKTIPPAGVVIDRSDAWAGKVRAARANRTLLVPAHKMATQYRYNTLNQVVSKKTPDDGITNYWYDRLGRLVYSQNAKQIGENKYSYTQYDALGRTKEVGELTSTVAMNDFISRDTTKAADWLSAVKSTRTDIAVTNYDITYGLLPPEYLLPENLRNRVSWMARFNDAAAQDAMEFSVATFYSYDIHGNVKTLLHDYKQGALSRFANRWKKIGYKYDLISGKVNWVGYQPGQKDAYYHRYSYDALNRLTNVETSRDSVFWENDAYYQYYRHGALARTVIGQQQVQGIDNAYTLEGWLKGINGTAGTSSFDIGGDGASGSQVAKDVFGYANHYYGNNDYKPVNSAVMPFAGGVGNKRLFNGNIAAMSQNTPSLGTALEYSYSYDVLNRIKGMTANKGLDSLTNSWTNAFTALPDFKEKINYDANGNILRYLRNGNNTFAGAPLAMDSMTYYYRPGTNKLAYIRDTVNERRYGNDIDNQGYDNYKYDSIGNMMADRRSGADLISWNVYGKISKIYKHDSTAIVYTYDVTGNRISKAVISKTNDTTQTWYVRDATGNILSVYNYNDATVNQGQLSQAEANLYGSSRLGMQTLAINVQDQTSPAVTGMTGLGNGKNITFIRGKKFFELTNHLGNVLAVVSDRKLGVSLNSSTVDHYNAVIVNAQDYYPFGMLMPGRGGHIGTGRNIASSLIKNGETVPATLVVNQRTNNTPATYMASESISFEDEFASGDGDEFGTLTVDQTNADLGSDNGVSYGIAAKGYRYGFNGKENDNEVKGEGNEQDYGMRIYDSRVGRFLSVDPITKQYPELTPYQYASNSPIVNIDIDGLESGNSNEIGAVSQRKTTLNNRLGTRAPDPHRVKDGDEILKKLFEKTRTAGKIVSLASKASPWVIFFEGLFSSSDVGKGSEKYKPGEIITDDPITLPDNYLLGVKQRLLDGTASWNDWRYKTELVSRGMLPGVDGRFTPVSEARSLLTKALNRQGLVYLPEKFKEKWSEGGYDYEVRIHPKQENAPEGSNSRNGTTYRVARRLQGSDSNGQGFGWEYVDDKNNWYKERDLKTGDNKQAANDTHIPLKG
ncbi:RHS repeat-associated core domain-containing protein [Chitinophaga sancti]|uniref:RHS repeat-associated core domain-containing protein n=1 Tax=Chitinophaga sancti TaxID=1004 RepID=A0A1K1SDJ2_9BACT|nr:RHS repeat-associated core domain-containing protein [Chitinophaga sancti]